MRYVPAGCLRPDMVLGKDVYSQDGVVLLAKNVHLTERYIEDIEKLVINGVYIEDKLSEDIMIKSLISDELKIGAVKSIRGIYNNPVGISKTLDYVEYIAKVMINEVLLNKSVMMNMIDIKSFDNFLYSHCVNVAVLSAVMGIGLNLDEQRLQRLVASALLHDIGKVFLPREVLTKKDVLKEEEKDILKKHPEKAYRYIKRYHNTIAVTSYVGVLQHHERFDGRGYPDGKKGEKISLFGRIISICDTYDNLISGGPNKKAYLPSEAIEYIMANSGSRFDPRLVKLFLKRVSPYPLGTIVKLSNKEKAIVIENNEECSIRPTVKTLEDSKIYDLTRNLNYRNITIVGVEQ